ncbi:MAG: VCBS repeat-containing protein, partial [Acidobacteriota bacterium]
MPARSTLSRLALLTLLAGAAAGAASPSAPPDADVQFTDITKATGIAFTHTSAPDKQFIVESMSGGVALFDFDRDGWLDVYLANAPTVAAAGQPARSALWRNNQDGTFTDVTARAGVGEVGWGMGVSTGDFDNDGWT